MKAWAVSLAVHGVVLGVATALWPTEPDEPEPLPFRWEVAFSQAAEAATTPTPPTPTPTPKPAPSPPPAPMPTPAAAPRHAPAPPEPEVPPPRPLPVPLPVPVVAPVVSQPVLTAPAVQTVKPVEASPRPVPVLPPTPVKTGPSPAELAAEAATRAAVEAERQWHAALVERLRQMKRYPLAARRLGQEGVVLLSVSVAADGRLEGVDMKRGSGYPLLDRDALKLLEEAAAAARAEMRPGRPARLEIPIAYKLVVE